MFLRVFSLIIVINNKKKCCINSIHLILQHFARDQTKKVIYHLLNHVGMQRKLVLWHTSMLLCKACWHTKHIGLFLCWHVKLTSTLACTFAHWHFVSQTTTVHLAHMTSNLANSFLLSVKFSVNFLVKTCK